MSSMLEGTNHCGITYPRVDVSQLPDKLLARASVRPTKHTPQSKEIGAMLLRI